MTKLQEYLKEGSIINETIDDPTIKDVVNRLKLNKGPIERFLVDSEDIIEKYIDFQKSINKYIKKYTRLADGIGDIYNNSIHDDKIISDGLMSLGDIYDVVEDLGEDGWEDADIRSGVDDVEEMMKYVANYKENKEK